MFFGASGSIAGGTMFTFPFIPRRHVCVDVEQRLRVALHVRQQPLHRRRVGRRDVDVAAPHPALRLLRHERVERGRLRVVDDADVPSARQLAGVHLVVLRPRRPLLLGEVLRVALERVVHDLRGVEELLAPVDHLPLDFEPDVAHQRHQRVEDLRHAAAERRRAQVDDASALERLRQLTDLLDERAPDEVRVVGEALAGQRDGLQHAANLPADVPERALAELDLDLLRVAAPVDLQRHLLAGLVGRDQLGELRGVLDRLAADLGDDVAAGAVRLRLEGDLAVAAADAGLLGGPAGVRRPGPTRPCRRRARSGRRAAGRARPRRRRGTRNAPRRRRAACRASA